MKQGIATILILLYALSSFGVGIQQFYCCGQLRGSSIRFLRQVPEKGTTESQGCCRTHYLSFKIKDSHQAPAYTAIPKWTMDASCSRPFFATSYPVLPGAVKITPDTGPPGTVHTCPLHILHCLFRI